MILNCPFSILPLVASEHVGMVSSLKVLESRSNVVRLTWVGVPGVTAYRVMWSRQDGKVTAQVYQLPHVPLRL